MNGVAIYAYKILNQRPGLIPVFCSKKSRFYAIIELTMAVPQQEWSTSDWLSEQEGKLSVDVMETGSHVIVRTAIAGVTASDLDITLVDDTLTIRGSRHHAMEEDPAAFTHVQECHWGSFSRTIILPAHVDSDSVDATMKRGILTITLKKVEMQKTIPVLDIDDL